MKFNMKKRICRAVVICSVLSAMSAEAKVLTSFEVNQNLVGNDTKTEIAVSGKSDADYVSLAVVNPGADETAADPNGSNIKDIYQILKNIKTNEDGTFLYKYTVTNASGEYKLCVGDDAPVVFKIMAQSDLQNFFDSVNSETTPAGMAQLFSQNADGLNISDFEANAMDKNALGAAVIADKPFADAEAAASSYKKNAAALILTNAANKSNFAFLADQYENILELNNLEDYDLYKTFTDEQKTELFGCMTNAGVKDYKSFKNTAAEQIVLVSLSHVKTYGEAEQLLKKYPGTVTIDWNAKLSGIKDPTSIYKGLSGNYYKSISELSAAADTLAAAQKTAENPTGGNTNVSGGGTGGGGGRTPSSTVITPVDKTPSKPQEDVKGGLKDIKDAEWAREYVEFLVGKNAISGDENGDFKPNDNVTREQFVKTIIAAFEIKGGEDPGFTDADKSAWYYDSISIAYKNKIVMGLDENTFGIGKTLTREEMAVFAYRAAKAAGYEFKSSGKNDFTDSEDIAEYAKEAVSVMNESGFIKGFPNGSFGPKETCTRAQMAVVIASILKSMN